MIIIYCPKDPIERLKWGCIIIVVDDEQDNFPISHTYFIDDILKPSSIEEEYREFVNQKNWQSFVIESEMFEYKDNFFHAPSQVSEIDLGGR